MKKLLIATDSFLPRWDGVARFLLELLPNLSSLYEITVVAPDFKGKTKPFTNIKIVRVPLSKIEAGDYISARLKPYMIKKLVQENDFVWTHTIGTIGTPAIYYANKFKKPVIAFVHSLEWELVSKSITSRKIGQSYIQIFIIRLMKYLYNRCNLLLVPSVDVAEKLKELSIKTKKSIVRLGVNTDVFIPPKNKRISKKGLNINPDYVVIGFSGRLGREKSLETLYKAFKRLEKRYKNLFMLAIGKGVRKIERKFSSNRNIKLVKYTNRILYYLQAMDIYVMPSLTETSSLSTMEAMACGLPIVTTKVGLIKHYVKDKINGCFFPKENDLVLSLKLEWLIKNKEIREQMGKRARETIVKKYQWSRTVDKIKKILREVCDTYNN